MAGISRTVLVLGLASLFTDISADMIYPLLPIFLATALGASAVQLGIIEGVAEATASILKAVSGYWTDRARRRKPIIVAGYAVSGIFRPLIGLAASWPVVLVLRFLDRVGKGIRTSPRDALIADITPQGRRGAAYGLHRGMDHAGSLLGPLVASGLLLIPGMGIRDVFLLAAVPAGITMAILVFGVRESGRAEFEPSAHAEPLHPIRDWKQLGPDFRRLLAAVGVFTLGNATDAFLLVRLAESGISPGGVSVLYACHNGAKMVSAALGGRLADRLGSRETLLAGWGLYAAVYLAFAFFDSGWALVATYMAYGFQYGLVEPSERAIIAELAPARMRGRAFGYFHLVVGLGALPASLVFGLVWKAYGAPAAFLLGASLAAIASAILFTSLRPNPKTN